MKTTNTNTLEAGKKQRWETPTLQEISLQETASGTNVAPEGSVGLITFGPASS